MCPCYSHLGERATVRGPLPEAIRQDLRLPHAAINLLIALLFTPRRAVGRIVGVQLISPVVCGRLSRIRRLAGYTPRCAIRIIVGV